MKFRLIYQGNDVRLGVGDHLIGRSSECGVVLSDPLASRHHALLQVEASQVTVQDVGSRNGVSVNGRRLSSSTVLEVGDSLTIGATQLVLVSGTSPRANSTTAREQAAEPRETLALLGRLANKSLALGNAREADRILRHHLENLLSRALRGHLPDHLVVGDAIDYASQLACTSSGGRWLSYIFELCLATESHASDIALERLYAGARRIPLTRLRALGDYIALHRAHQESLTPHQRFMLSRAEGLWRRLQV